MKMSAILRPRTIYVHGGGSKMFGSHTLRQKVYALLHKLSQAYRLYSPSCALCKHEVAALGLRCASLGNWFPTNYLLVPLKRKLHTLTFHIPAKAMQNGTVGMEAEHLSESIHPRAKRFERAAATIQDMKQKLLYICQSVWLESSSDLPNFRLPDSRR